MQIEARRWIVVRTPGLDLTPECFELRKARLPNLAAGQVLVRGLYHLLSPSLRARLTYATYAAPLEPGDAVPGTLLGVVEASRSSEFAVGDHVTGALGWTTHAVADGSALQRLDPTLFGGAVPLEAALGSLGVNGLTAHIGLLSIGRAKSGETVLVSSAAGAVGSLVCQIARIRGCRTIGIAGSDGKCGDLVSRFGVATAINHRRVDDLAVAIRAACPDGVDVFFDNVGGHTLDAGVRNLRNFGRAVICGRTATYADGESRLGGMSPSRRIRLEGFIAYDHSDRFDQILADLTEWVASGRLRDDFTMIPGIENSIDAFLAQFSSGSSARPIVAI